MTNLISFTIPKVKGKDIEKFMEEQSSEKPDFKRVNPLKDQEQKAALEMYHALSKPLDGYMNSIVTATGLALKDVIGNYRFKTPDGLYVTQHYNTFDRLKGNRDVDPKHVAEIIGRIKKEGYAFRMGTVNEKGEVIEGQHGLVAVSYLKAQENQTHPYIFHIQPEAGVEEVEQQNTARDEWDTENRLQSGISLNLPTYIKLGDMIKGRLNSRFGTANVIDVACRGSQVLKEDFEKRRLELSDEQLNKTEKFLSKIIEIHDTLYPEKANRKISWSWGAILIKLFDVPNFTLKRLLEVIKDEENPSPSVQKLRKLKSQNKEIVCGYIIEAYNYKRVRNSSNFLDIRDWQDLKRRSTSYADLDRLTLR